MWVSCLFPLSRPSCFTLPCYTCLTLFCAKVWGQFRSYPSEHSTRILMRAKLQTRRYETLAKLFASFMGRGKMKVKDIRVVWRVTWLAEIFYIADVRVRAKSGFFRNHKHKSSQAKPCPRSSPLPTFIISRVKNF